MRPGTSLKLSFMKFQAASVNTQSFVHFILPWIRLQKAQFDERFPKRQTKRRCCVNYIGSDSNVTTHKSEQLFYYITIALSVKQIV